MKHKLMLALGLAALAACAMRGGSPMPPSATDAVAPSLRDAASTIPHAACSPPTGLVSPIAGTPVVGTAYGQLIQPANAARYAFTGVTFAYPSGKKVFAATSGTATYYADLKPYGAAIVIKSTSGAETLYASFARSVLKLSKKHTAKVKAGQEIAVSGKSDLLYEYAPAGNIVEAGAQSNPCGTSNGASGSISIMPSAVAVYARFHTLAVNGAPIAAGPYPSGDPDVPTPSTISAANTDQPATIAATMYERSDVSSGYYVVLCGNAVFKTGNARYAGPFTYTQGTTSVTTAVPSPLPQVVFFRDPGTQSTSLIETLPAPYNQACPAPPPANVYVFASPTFYQIGQTEFAYYTSNTGQSGDTVMFTSSSTTVVTASPSPLAVFATAPPTWPPPTPHADFTATGFGTATITVFDSSCACNDTAINVTVASPSPPAPVPSPLPNN